MSPNLEWWAKGVGLLLGWGPKGGGPKPRKVGPRRVGPGRVGPPRVGGPKFRAFFPPPPATIFFLSSLSWGSFRGILVGFLKRRGPEMCTFGVLGLSCASPGGPVWCCRRGFTRQPESPNVHISGFRPSKHHQNSTKGPPRERRKNKNCGGRGEKKREILGGPAEGSGGGAVWGRGPGEHTNLGPDTHSRHTQGGPAEPVLSRGGHEEGCPAEEGSGGKWGERTKQHTTRHTTHPTQPKQQHNSTQQHNKTTQHNNNTQTTQTTQQHTPHTDAVFFVPSSVFYSVPMSFFLSRVFVLFVPFVVFYFVPNVCFFCPVCVFFCPDNFVPFLFFLSRCRFFLSRYRNSPIWTDLTTLAARRSTSPVRSRRLLLALKIAACSATGMLWSTNDSHSPTSKLRKRSSNRFLGTNPPRGGR